MKKAQCCGVGAVILLSAAVSAVTTLVVLVVHALCKHGTCESLCESDGFCILPDPTEES